MQLDTDSRRPALRQSLRRTASQVNDLYFLPSVRAAINPAPFSYAHRSETFTVAPPLSTCPHGSSISCLVFVDFAPLTDCWFPCVLQRFFSSHFHFPFVHMFRQFSVSCSFRCRLVWRVSTISGQSSLSTCPCGSSISCRFLTVYSPMRDCWFQCLLQRFYRSLLASVPARLGKGQGAKEIGHNLARERPKFGHNLVRKRHKIFYAWTTKIWSCGRLMKIWAQICKHFTSIFTSAVWKHKNSNYIL